MPRFSPPNQRRNSKTGKSNQVTDPNHANNNLRRGFLSCCHPTRETLFASFRLIPVIGAGRDVSRLMAIGLCVILVYVFGNASLALIQWVTTE